MSLEKEIVKMFAKIAKKKNYELSILKKLAKKKKWRNFFDYNLTVFLNVYCSIIYSHLKSDKFLVMRSVTVGFAFNQSTKDNSKVFFTSLT